MKKVVIHIGAALVIIAASLALGYVRGRKSANQILPIVRTDSIVFVQEVVKEVVKEKPVLKYVDRVRTEYIEVHTGADSVEIKRDTLYIPVPIEQKVYGDSMYTAYVSGYKPSLDSIRLFIPEKYATKTFVTNTARPEKGLRFGVQAGVGAVAPFTPGATPSLGGYFGVGISLVF